MEDNQTTTTSDNTRALKSVRYSLFFVSWPFFLLSLLLPVYGREIGANAVQIGLFFSVFSFMMVVFRPIVGWGLDRIGRRPFFLLGLAGYAAAMLGFAFSDQVWGIYAARVLQGIGASFTWLAVYAITADLAHQGERAKIFGTVTEAPSRGALLGTFVGMSLLTIPFSEINPDWTFDPWPLVFGIFGLVSLLALLIAWRGVPETNPGNIERVRQPIRWSQTWLLLLLVTFVTGSAWGMTSPVLIIFLQDKLGVGIDLLSWAFLPSGLIWAFLPATLGRLADRFGRKPMMLLGLVMAAITSFIIPGLNSLVGLAILWSLQALCYAAGDPAEQALVTDLTGGDQRGRAFGLYALAADLGATVGPFGGTWLYQNYGAQAPFYANGLVLALNAVLLWLFLKLPKHIPIQADH